MQCRKQGMITRRAALGLAGTLTALALPRKPARAADLRGVDALVLTKPPAKPPAFSFEDAQGAKKTLTDFAGKGVVLNFWATWCVPCVAELPSLDKLAGMLDPAKIAVLPLSSDTGGRATVDAFYRKHGIAHLGVWLDPNGDAEHALELRGIPTTVLVDAHGLERGRLEGGVDWASAQVVQMVRGLVG